ncbi:MAG: twin-arginine translocase TatA/TatE family subunit [Candidatus Hatepunaea meridiana]|nr:twin-arginine translocase TatA/TatE family subunit [Candidatus Hatepunaea meridiana]
MSSSELLVVAVAALLLFGGKKLPEFLRTWGRIMRDIKRNYYEFKRQIGLDEFDDVIKKK